MKMTGLWVWQLVTLVLGAAAASNRLVEHYAGSSVGALPRLGLDAIQASVVKRDAAAANTNSSVSLEMTLGNEVMKLILGKGPTVHHIAKLVNSKMDLAEAVTRVSDKLPEDLNALVRVTSDTKKAKAAKARGEFDEASLGKARRILNGMVEGSQKDLDSIMIECKEFEERNRGTFGQVVTDLARLGASIADLSRKRVAANEDINSLDATRRTSEDELQKATLDFTTQRLANEAELTIRTNDLAVFNFILEIVRCQESALVQIKSGVEVLEGGTVEPVQVCKVEEDDLGMKFDDPKVQAKFERLMTPSARQALRQALGQVQAKHMALLGRRGRVHQHQVPPNTTTPAIPTFTAETLPVVEEPAAGGQWKKCTDGRPNCGLLHDTMSIQWGKFKDLVDELTFIMHKNADAFEELKENLNEQLTVLGDQKTKSMEMLAEVISGINADTEEMAEKDTQHHELEHAYKKKMAECKAQIEEILFTNICAVRKVRNAVMTHSTVSPPAKISDCDVADWIAQECSMDCDDSCPQTDPYACGGWQTLTREVVVQPNTFGIACPPLETQKKCNQFKCPVDCVLSEWSGWAKCTKDCEGGVQGKTRSILTKAKNGGESCDSGSEMRSCNTGSCDRDCTLTPWTEWSPCSMACGGGDQSRLRNVVIPIRGQGKCPAVRHPDRLEDRACNTQDCVGDEICIASMDLIIALDSSGSLKESGYDVVRDFAANLTGRYEGEYYGKEMMQVGAIVFGNGRVMPDGTIAPAVNVQGLTADMSTVRERILETSWQRGLTNMAQAFTLAGTMLQQGGRPEAQSAVLVLSDGKYSFAFQTEQQVQKLKDSNVQIFMAPVADAKDDSLILIKQWASQPWQTNYERIPGLLALEHNLDMFAGKLVAKFCSKSMSPSAQLQKEEESQFMLIHEDGYPDDSCGHWNWHGRGHASQEDCMMVAREMNTSAFAYGKGLEETGCYSEAIEVTMELWNQWSQDRTSPPCPQGTWIANPFYDTYAIMPTE
jgi:hypothetical protein